MSAQEITVKKLIYKYWTYIINATGKKMHVIVTYTVCILAQSGLLCGNFLNFLLWLMIFIVYSLQFPMKGF